MDSSSLPPFLHDMGKPRSMEVDEKRVRFFGHDSLGGEMAQRVGRQLRLSRRATTIHCDGCGKPPSGPLI